MITTLKFTLSKNIQTFLRKIQVLTLFDDYKAIKFKINQNLLFIIFFALLLNSCTSIIRYSSNSKFSNSKFSTVKSATSYPIGTKFIGYASYYADSFDGKQTASGEIFDNVKFTAAHLDLAFGTKLKIKNLANNKTCIVVVNDRGPFVEDRIIDLSKAAASQLDMIKKGVAEVEIEIIE